MWLSRVFWTLYGFATAYLKIFRDAGFDLFQKISLTRSQIGRFYWVNLILCAFVLYFLFVSARQLRAAHPMSSQACYPDQSLPAIACLILSEVASFILLVGAQIETWMLYGCKDTTPDHPILANISSRSLAARKLHLLLWTWFPLVLGTAVYFSQTRLNEVAAWCDALSPDQYSGIRHGANLVFAVVWPGLTISFLFIASVNWALYRWKPSRNLTITLLIAFLSYILAITVVGPSDLLGIVKLCREITDALVSIFKTLVGTGAA